MEKEISPVIDSDVVIEDTDGQPTPRHPRESMSSLTWILVLVGVYLGAILYGLDTTIAASVQSPTYQTFGSIKDLPWIGIGFPMASVAVILLVGRLYEYFNIKYLLIASFVVFETGSALCGGASSSKALIVGRVIAGAGGAGLYLAALSYISVFSTDKELPLYNALIGLSWGIGAILGPVVGGALSDSDATWRWAFYINLPLAAVLSPLYVFVFPSFTPNAEVRSSKKIRRIDWIGAAIHCSVFFLLTTALTFSVPPNSWNSSTVIGLWVGFGVALIAYIVQQYFALFTSAEDRIFPAQYFQSKDMVLLFICTCCGGAVEGVTLYYIPLFFSFTHGDSSMKVAVRLLPLVVVFVVFVIIAGALLPATGRYATTYTLGGTLSLIGSSLLFTIDETTKPSTIYGFEALVGAGTGLMFQNAYAIVTRKVERHRKPRAIGFINVAQLGSVAVALAIAACVFENKGVAALRDALADFNFSESDLISALSGAHSALTSGDNPEIAKITIHCVAHTVSRIFGMGIAAGALAICCSLLMDQRKLSTVTLVKGENTCMRSAGISTS